VGRRASIGTHRAREEGCSYEVPNGFLGTAATSIGPLKSQTRRSGQRACGVSGRDPRGIRSGYRLRASLEWATV